MRAVEEFEKTLSRCNGLALKRWGRKLQPLHLFQVVKAGVPSEPLCGLYVKEASERHGSQGYFWGLDEEPLQSLIRMRCRRWVVLLFGSREEGFVATGDSVNGLVTTGKLRIDAKRQYKIHESEIRTEFSTEFSKCQNFQEIFTTLDLPKE